MLGADGIPAPVPPVVERILQLILLTGYPSSGKSQRASQLYDFFSTKFSSEPRFRHLQIHLVSDDTLGLGRDVYRHAREEKDARAAEYSAVKRLLGRDSFVIADGLNYIKGFRYQLYCEARAMSTPSCVVCGPSAARHAG